MEVLKYIVSGPTQGRYALKMSLFLFLSENAEEGKKTRRLSDAVRLKSYDGGNSKSFNDKSFPAILLRFARSLVSDGVKMVHVIISGRIGVWKGRHTRIPERGIAITENGNDVQIGA